MIKHQCFQSTEFDQECPECGEKAVAMLSEIERGNEFVHNGTMTVHRVDRDVDRLYYIHTD